MKIQLKKTSDLIEYENNPRNNDEAVDIVAESIKEFGFKVPIVIDSNNVIIAGHTRVKASIKLGLREVPCIVADDLTEEQIREYALLDNKTNELADWDFELLGEELADLDLSDFELDWGITEPLDFEDDEEVEASEVQKKLCKCPVCGHINEEKAFKYYEDTE